MFGVRVEHPGRDPRVIPIIGRSASVGGLRDADVVIEHPSVGPRHGRFVLAEDGAVSFAGAASLLGARRRRVPVDLSPGDSVRLADVTLRLVPVPALPLILPGLEGPESTRLPEAALREPPRPGAPRALLAGVYRDARRRHDLPRVLDALLALPPSAATWRALCHTLEALAPSPSSLSDVLGRLERWPPSLRVTPALWWRRLAWPPQRASPLLSTVRRLRLDLDDVPRRDSGWLQRLARCQHLRELHTLALTQLQLDDDDLHTLARGVLAPRALDLSSNLIGPQGVEHLCASSLAERLEHLDLSGNRVGDEGATVLAASPSLRELDRLDLYRNGVGPRGIEALHTSAYLSEAALASY